MNNIVVLVTPGLEPETSRLQTAIGSNSRATIAGPVPLVVLGSDESAAIEYARAAAGNDGSVTALSVGDARADASLRYALAQGADRAIRVDSVDASTLSTESVAKLVVLALNNMEPTDLLVLGQRGSAYATGLLPGYLAALTGRGVLAHITGGAGKPQKKSEQPSVVAVTRDRSCARNIPSLAAINDAHDSDIQVVTVDQNVMRNDALMKVVKNTPGERSAIVHAQDDLQALARETAKLILSVQSDA